LKKEINMGLSTFIEINNDFTNEIENNKMSFLIELLSYLNSGDKKQIKNKAISRIITVHRDENKCKELQHIISN
jgi:hypothetical protein